MSTVIKVENLSKLYYLSHQQKEKFPTLRDAISRSASQIGKRLLHPLRASSGQPLEGLDSTEEFWALNEVSFEVRQGERVGIIGRNGAGKSTLLKVLSRITEPTKGRVSIKGRAASLLEVGTGFHPELTGRENIFLNGAVLGMSKADIRRRFDEIVAFSEIENFLDTPVKRYSSGMYVRLAFAVAAHLEPEILMIDEILAVGDQAFQRKCLGKMDEVAKEGRTVFFVSHQMASVANLCTKVIWLTEGSVFKEGPPKEIVEQYLLESLKPSLSLLHERKDRVGDGRIKFTAVWVENLHGERNMPIASGDTIKIKASFEVLSGRSMENIVVGISIYDMNGSRFTTLSNALTGDQFISVRSSRGEFCCTIPDLPLCQGRYVFNLIVRSGTVVEDWIKNAGFLEVFTGDYYITGVKAEGDFGNVFLKHSWNIQQDELRA